VALRGNPSGPRSRQLDARDLKTLLDDVPDTLEIVLRAPRERTGDPFLDAWQEAREDAASTLAAWRAAPADRLAYVAYRAAQDREDAAQDVLRVGAVPARAAA
jgi:hypothetical protein